MRDVVAVDIQEYSRVLCSALLLRPEITHELQAQVLHDIQNSAHLGGLTWAIEPLVAHERRCIALAIEGKPEGLCNLVEQGSLVAFELGGSSIVKDPLLKLALQAASARLKKARLHASPNSLVTRYFGGVYFSYQQASQLDAVLEVTARVEADRRDTFLAAVLSTASEVVNTVGKQFAQPIRPRNSSGEPKRHLLDQINRDRHREVFAVYESWLKRYVSLPRTDRIHRIIRQDYEGVLQTFDGELSVVYADPPYTRDHYSRFYHVLETLCLRDNPRVSTMRIRGKEQISRGIYRTERYQSPFCIRSQAPGAFTKLFSAVKKLGVPLVLSYSPDTKYEGARPRVMTIEKIGTLAREYFSRTEVTSAGRISHNKLNNAERNLGASYDAEVLFICEP